MRPRLVLAAAGLGVVLAFQAQAATPGDPLESMNRHFFASSANTDKRFVRPLARLYRLLTPGPIGVVIHNVVTNLSEPSVVANDILQARLRQAARDTARLALNSTFGILGLVDVATPNGLAHHDNDFGITLGVWGFGPGPYLYLPLLGPSTVRDAIGKGVDAAASPLNYVRFPGRMTLDISTQVVGGLDLRARTESDQDALLADATDPYATLRSVYLQSREAQIKGEDATPSLPQIDQAAPAAKTPVLASQAPPPMARAATDHGDEAVATGADDPDGVVFTARPWDIDGAPSAHGA